MPEIPITLTFFEPYRLMAWYEEKQKTEASYLRGQGFARCRKDADGGVKTLQITGTLLRSAVIRAAEKIICLGNDRYGRCCNGEFKTSGDKPFFLRKRPTLVTLRSERAVVCQSKEDACALCLLLGRFDKAGKYPKNKGDVGYDICDHDIHFNNLNLTRYGKSIKLSDIATERGFNRVNYHTGKARDYFKVWEVDDEDYWTFQGVITVNEQEKTAEQLKQLDKLLRDSLGFIDKLCGAICRITLSQKGFNHEEREGTKKDLQTPPKDVREEPKAGLSEEIRNDLRKSAKDIVDAFDKSDKIEKARTLADVVRAMRLEKPDIIGKLPKGRDGKDHHLWDVKVDAKSIRQVLKELWNNIKAEQEHTPSSSQEGNIESPLPGGDLGVGKLSRETHSAHNKWRSFCETLGNDIYREYKKKTGGFSPQLGILGEAVEYHAKPDSSDTCITLASGNTVTKEWIIVGNLKAITPFFFGTESGENDQTGEEGRGEESFFGMESGGGDQTSYRILLSKKGHYRMPRSLMRGVLRRDLRTAFDSGCNAEPGGMMPCNCPVCIIMRRITIMDSRSSDYKEPPDIRYRIRMNPQTATVDEGALFDMEVGPEGITFPFVLRYRGEGESLPVELWSVIRYWMDGRAWFGGSGSTGKGRFALEEDVKVYTWELSGKGLENYIEKGGLRGDIGKVEKGLEENANKSPGLAEMQEVATLLQELKGYAPYKKHLQPQWEEVAYTITIAAPLLTADTIAALLEPGNRDSIAYRKRVWDAERNELTLKFTIKGETIRGIVRTAVGKQHGLLGMEHEDCDCESCMTFINIFGNEHEAGKIRFEDLEVTIKDGELETAPNCKKIDHVAIDRFTGGAVDKKKFDTYPIAGSPNNPILLEGTFWTKRDLTDTEKGLIGDALLDIKQGLYPIGGKTGIGYGWVSDLVVQGASGYFSDLAEGKGKTDAQEAPSEVCPPYNKPRPPQVLPDGKNGERFYPHYFLEPDKDVKREPFLPELGHEKFKHGLLTGKIRCSLKTLTPLIIPDSMYHYDFFDWEFTQSLTVESLCNAINSAISGLPLKSIPGTISWLNELLTVTNLYDMAKKPDKNFSQDVMEWIDKTKKYRDKVFSDLNEEEKGAIKILNRLILEELFPEKMPKSNKHKRYRFFKINDELMIPGSEIRGTISTVYEAITNSCFRIMDKDIRLSWRIKAEGLNKYKKGRIIQSKEDGKFELEIFKKSARLPFYNGNVSCFKEEQINGEKPVNLWVKNFVASVAEKKGWIEKTGYLKVTGPNKVEVCDLPEKLPFVVYEGIPEDWQSIRINGTGLDGKTKVFRCKSDGKLYTMSKWCETFFYDPDENKKTIDSEVLKQYRNLIEKYQNNPQKPPEIFQSFPVKRDINDCLKNGDLVYVLLDEKEAVREIFPVQISRHMDKDVIVSKMKHDGLRPCEGNILEDFATSMTKDFSLEQSTSFHSEELCPACRLFGTTNYKGRVRFGFARSKEVSIPKLHKDGAGGDGAYVTLPLLACPRPTWSIPKDSADFKVPGRKFYVHHNGWEKEEKNRNENNRTVEYLGEDNAFTFDIFFENLEKWELGLLLYSLELEPENNLAHKVGMAKAHGFGSTRITINNIFFRVNPIIYKMVNGSRCKNRLIDTGYAKLREWDGAGKEWYDIPRIQKLRKLLTYETENKRKVEYPELEKEGDLPGYVELGKKENWLFKDRVECLTTPWSPWHPHKTPKNDKQELKSEIKDTITGESIGHKGDLRKYTPKHKIPLSNKYSGIIKSFEKNGEIVVAKENGGDIHVWYYEKTVLNVGQKIKFRVEQGAMFTKIYDVEIAK